ncbi:MAG: TPM domain-containing protein, partial [Candidatus Limnocylindrales bacterium]
MTLSRFIRVSAALSVAIALLVPASVLAAGPPFPAPVPDQQAYDPDGVLLPSTRNNAQSIADSVRQSSGADVVVYAQRLATDSVDQATADAHAAALLQEWDLGGDDGTAIVFLVEAPASGTGGVIGLATGAGMERFIDAAERAAIADQMTTWIEGDDLDFALIVGMAEVIRETLTTDDGPGIPAGPGRPADAPPIGPPFPEPVADRAVYDYSGIFSEATIAAAEATIDEIEQRTGAELAVYSQVVDYGVTTDETERRARALIDQWGIGRVGFDDGMVIFFDLDPSMEHGQVQLYAAPGFEATYLSNADRQRIFENDMVPFLASAEFDEALVVALEKIDDAATPENAARLQAGRQINAALGLVGAPIVLLGLAGWAFISWRRFGKDPVYLDDPSILMPAPPPDLTAASGAFLVEGGASRRALTTAMLDLASRGLIAFREEKGLLGLSTKVGVDTEPPKGDDVTEAQRARNSRRPTGPAEAVALRRLKAIDGAEHFIEPDELPKFGLAVASFDAALEEHVVARGWMVEKPSKVVGRWVLRGLLAVGAGVAALIAGISIPISGLVMIGIAAIVGGIVVCLFAAGMPTVTMPGAMIRAMLAAYRRTLQKTMEQARSMQQVVETAGLDWLETPDQAVVWGTALGLQHEIEDVLKRSLEDVSSGRSMAAATYFPAWYQNSSGSSFASAAAAGSGGSIFSGSAVPDLGGMMSALGTIGNSP